MSSPPDAAVARPGEAAALSGALVAVLIWGSYFTVIDELLRGFDAYTLSLLRTLLAAVSLLTMLALREGRAGFRGAIPFGRLLLLGTFGSGSLVLLFTLGVQYAGPVTAALVASTAPALTALVARLMFGERLGPRMRVAVILAVLGGAVIVVGAHGGIGLPRWGDLVILVAYAAWSWYLCAAQRWLAGWSQLRITASTMSIGALISLAGWVALRAAGLSPGQWSAAPTHLALVVYASVIGIAGAAWLWNHAVNVLGVTRSSVIGNLVPVMAVPMAVLAGAPVPGPVEVAGALLVLAGIIQAQRAGPPREALAEAVGVTRPFATRKLRLPGFRSRPAATAARGRRDPADGGDRGPGGS